MTRQEKEFKMLCEKFIQSPPKYRMKIVLPQLLESIENNKTLNEDFLDDLQGTVKGWFGTTGVNSIWERVISSVLNGMGMEEGFLRDTVEVVLANSNCSSGITNADPRNKFRSIICLLIVTTFVKFILLVVLVVGGVGTVVVGGFEGDGESGVGVDVVVNPLVPLPPP
jgi:hypothetical protein